MKLIFGTKLIVRLGWYRGHIIGVSWRKYLVEKVCFSYADKIILTNKKAIDFISKSYGIPENKLVYIPNGIDVKLFSPVEMSKNYDILYVGNFTWIKNLRILLKVIAGIGDKNLKVLFIGSGILEENLKTFAIENNIDLSIKDRVDNIELPAYYNSTRIFVLPSKFEGNPKVLLEAMSCGASVLGTNVGGINDLIIHNKTGYLCEPDPLSMKEAINIMLNDDNLRKSLGIAAREYIKSNNSMESIVDTENEVYNSIV